MIRVTVHVVGSTKLCEAIDALPELIHEYQITVSRGSDIIRIDVHTSQGVDEIALAQQLQQAAYVITAEVR